MPVLMAVALVAGLSILAYTLAVYGLPFMLGRGRNAIRVDLAERTGALTRVTQKNA